MKATHIILIAHGLTAAQRSATFPSYADALLPSQQAGAMARGTLLCGPELRTRQSAALLGTPQVQEDLRDCDYGTWQGKAVSALPPADVAQWLSEPAYAGHGGESFLAVCKRVAQWLQAVPNGRSVAITHPMLLRAAFVHGLGLPPAAASGLDIAPWARLQLSYSSRWRVQLLAPR